MSAEIWLIIFILFIILNFVFSSILEYINDKNWKNEIPIELKDFYNKEQYLKAKNYKKARGKVSLISSCISTLLTLLILSTGFYGYVSDYIYEIYSSKFIHSAIFFLFFYLINMIINIPISYYSTFVVEEEFGFNKTTLRVFFTSFSKFKLNNNIIKKVLDDCSHLIISGITPPLSDICNNNFFKLVEKAKSADIKIVYDINYRKDLWSRNDCKNFNLKFLKYVDVLFTNSNTFNHVFDIKPKFKLDGFYSESEETLKNILNKNKIPIICMTVRNKNQIGGLIFKNKTINKSDVYDINHVDRVGAGDSFTGAVMYGFLKGWPEDKIISFAAASFAISHTKFGDVNCFNDDEIESFRKNNSITNA